MTRAVVLAGLAASLAATGNVRAQPLSGRRLAGTGITGSLERPAANLTRETVTLKFSDACGRTAISIDCIVQYEPAPTRTTPTVVDLVITEHAPDQQQPVVTLQIDDAPLPVVARPKHERSVVVSMPFDEFLRLARAERVVERAFDSELVFSAAQIRMLRSAADRWASAP